MPDQDPLSQPKLSTFGSDVTPQTPGMSPAPKPPVPANPNPVPAAPGSAATPQQAPLSQPKLSFSKMLSGVLGAVVHKEISQDVDQKTKEASIYLKALGDNPTPEQAKIILDKLQKVYPTKGGKEAFGKVQQLLGGLTSFRTEEGRQRQAAQQQQQSQFKQQEQLIKQREQSQAEVQGQKDEAAMERERAKEKAKAEEDRLAREEKAAEAKAARTAKIEDINAAAEAKQKAADASQKRKDTEAENYAATLPPAEAAEFRKYYENKKLLGNANPAGKPPAVPADRNVPGAKILEGHPDAKDSFGNALDPKSNYTVRGDKYTPEAPPPKTETENPEVRANEEYYKSIGKDPETAKRLALADFHASDVLKRKEASNRVQNTEPIQLIPEDRLRALAEVQVRTGQKPAAGVFGLGAHDPNRPRYAIVLADTYAANPDYQASQAAYKAGTANRLQLEKVKGQIEANEDGFQYDIEAAQEASKKVSRSQAAAFNSLDQLLQANLTQYPELAEFRSYTQTLVNTYAKVMTASAGSGGVTSDTARKDAERIINTKMSQGDYEGAIRALKVDADNRVKGYKKAIEEADSKLRSQGQKVVTEPKTTGPAPKNADDYCKKHPEDCK